MTELENVQADLVLDLKGLVCPIPVVKIASAVKGLDVGDVVQATATDPGIMADIPAWCRSTGNELLKIGRKEDRTFVFWVRKVN